MSRIGLLVLAVVVFSVGCGYGSHHYMTGGMGSPQIMQLQPNMAQAGSGAMTLTVTGTGFGTDSVVYWNMVPQASSYVSGSKVTAEISAADLMNAGMVPVYVLSGGKASNSVNFTVQ